MQQQQRRPQHAHTHNCSLATLEQCSPTLLHSVRALSAAARTLSSLFSALRAVESRTLRALSLTLSPALDACVAQCALRLRSHWGHSRRITLSVSLITALQA